MTNTNCGRPERWSRNRPFAIGRRSPPALAIHCRVIPRVAGLPVGGAARLDLRATSECGLAKTDDEQIEADAVVTQHFEGRAATISEYKESPRRKDLPPTRVCKARQDHQCRYGSR